MNAIKNYLHNVLIGLDQFANTIIHGNPGETISARSGRAAKQGKLWGKVLAWILGKIQRNHCDIAIQADKERAEGVQILENGAQQK